MAAQPVRGLVNFIIDLKGVPSEVEKEHRVRVELSKIRCCFGRTSLNGYEKRKCLLKLVYIHMIGYDVDLGHVESVHLMASTAFQEKIAGYMGCEVLVADMTNLTNLATNTVMDDLHNTNEHVQALALNFIANSFSLELNEHMFDLLVSIVTAHPFQLTMLRKKAYMCILQLLKTNPDLFRLKDWKEKMVDLLSKEMDISCLMPLTNLMLGFVRLDKDGWDACILIVLQTLLHLHQGSMQGDSYYNVESPWLVVKLLDFLASVEPKPADSYMTTLAHMLGRMRDRMCAIRVPMRQFGKHYVDNERDERRVWSLRISIAQETIRAIANWLRYMPTFKLTGISEFMDKLLSSKSSHVYVTALEMADNMLPSPQLHSILKGKVPRFVALVSSRDSTVRHWAVKVVSQLCDDDNWETVVPEMLSVLRDSEVTAQNFIAPLLLDLIERVMPRGTLYVDSVFKVIQCTHDITSLSDVCRRVLRSGSRHQQVKVATKCVSVLSGMMVNDGLLRICATMLGDYGHVVEEVGMAEQATMLQRCFVLGSPTTKCAILTTLVKFAARDSQLWKRTASFLESHTAHRDVHVQSTACELLRMMLLGKPMLQSLILGESDETASSRSSESVSVVSSVIPKIADRYRVNTRRHSRTSSLSRESDSDDSAYDGDAYDSNGSSSLLLLERLLSNSPGEIFSDGNFLSVWVEQAYRRCDAKLLVRIRNISKGYEVINVISSTLRCSPSLEGLCHNSGTGVLAPGESIGHKLSFVLLRVDATLPQYCIEYSVERNGALVAQRRVVLRLPAALNKFLSPLAVEPSTFMQMWHSLEDTEVAEEVAWNLEVDHFSAIVSRCMNAHIVKISNTEGAICCCCQCAEGDALICIARFSARFKGRRLQVKARGSNNAVASRFLECVLSSVDGV